MERTVRISFTRTDPESVTGEEFDAELQDAIAGIDIEGYEVEDRKTTIMTPAEVKQKVADNKWLAQLQITRVNQLRHLLTLSPDDKDPYNPGWTAKQGIDNMLKVLSFEI